jgi:hypothetical protein
VGFLNQQPAHGYDLHEHSAAELGQIWCIRRAIALAGAAERTSADQAFNRLGLEFHVRQLTSAMNWLADCKTQLGLNR